MAYKFNALTGKMDLVNSAAEISADLAITGETFEKHGNLQPQVLDHVPVNEVMSDILFRTYAPKVTAGFGNQNAYHDETIAIKPAWTVERRSNALHHLKVECAALGTLNNISLTENASNVLISQEGATIAVYATVSDVAGSNGKKKSVVLTAAESGNLSFTSATTIKATAYDVQDNTSEQSAVSLSFHYPLIVGSINDMSVKAATINYDGTDYVVQNVTLGNNVTETQNYLLRIIGRDGDKSFNQEVSPYEKEEDVVTPYYPIILVHSSLKIGSIAQVDGSSETVFNPNMTAGAVTVTFNIGGVKKWDATYDRYMLVRDSSTADNINYKFSITNK